MLKGGLKKHFLNHRLSVEVFGGRVLLLEILFGRQKVIVRWTHGDGGKAIHLRLIAVFFILVTSCLHYVHSLQKPILPLDYGTILMNYDAMPSVTEPSQALITFHPPSYEYSIAA